MRLLAGTNVRAFMSRYIVRRRALQQLAGTGTGTGAHEVGTVLLDQVLLGMDLGYTLSGYTSLASGCWIREGYRNQDSDSDVVHARWCHSCEPLYRSAP